MTNPLKKGNTYTHLFIVNGAIYNGFRTTFNDNNPLHTNEQFAKQKGFKTTVMHGNILCGFISYFIGELLPSKDVLIHSQEINYTNPVYLNDELTLNATVEDVFESVKVIEFKFIFENQHKQKVAKGKITIGLL